jgi:hypothetical protein
VCTVSYIAHNKGFTLTSNRDELASRPTLPPAEYDINGNSLFFPKDTLGEGSWIACDKKGQVSCLLNGAFEKHKRILPYNRSRGKILLESFSYHSIETFLNQVDLNKVEPFTLILVKNEMISELRWDGNKKHIKKLDAGKNYLWSSPTLYPADVILKKEGWFNKWITKYAEDTQKNILKFHSTRHGIEPTKDVNSKFNSDLQTVSITQIKNTNNKGIMEYHDLMNKYINKIVFKTDNHE